MQNTLALIQSDDPSYADDKAIAIEALKEIYGDEDYVEGLKNGLPLQGITDELLQKAEEYTYALTRLSGLTYEAAFFSALRLSDTLPDEIKTAPSEQTVAYYDDWADRILKESEQLLGRLQGALIGGKAGIIAETAQHVIRDAQQLITLEAARYSLFLSLNRAEQKEAEFEAECKTAVKASEAFEWIGVASVYAAHILGMSGGVVRHDVLNDAIKSAQKLPFTTARPKGKKIKPLREV